MKVEFLQHPCSDDFNTHNYSWLIAVLHVTAITASCTLIASSRP
jgi:hypothetical protein